ncbi:hypothetical protein PEBR_16313 [Penicillium brasilianum]|uniref:Uncharacterized protein n=1 Tax=Penicillium brasilianum TaxID=104259 RepID=A0A1S9RQE0_PENBI|nr:hypothetical protein PEBR_16313 [Penicillium brasilianum]
MTTASSLTFATMEVPALEDSMEMASPYQGQADDFDIDLDLMEDNVSNMDSDMMGADDFPNTSQVSLFAAEVNDDADMADEPSEGSMVDTDLVDEDPDIDVQYEQSTYEADMLEGDQDDQPVLAPSIHIEVQPETVEHEDKASEIPRETKESESQSIHDGLETALPEPVSVSNEPQEPQPQEEVVEEEELPPVSSETQDGQPGYTEGDGTAEPEVDRPDIEPHETNETTGNTETTDNRSSSVEGYHQHNDASVEKVENLESEQDAKSDAHESEYRNPEHLEATDSHESEAQHTHEEEESLHPVKVLYQEAEISLFPPMEGDSAETFFLHDEDVAYDNFGKLFSALREVLLDNVAENEVLVIDIDSLGIQITEDSSLTSNVTLHRILNIYLRLCQNDKNNEPEALYLTLSSRPAVHSELADLEAAANEGKGLSQVHLWSEFEDGEENEDHRADEHSVEGSPRTQGDQALSFHENEDQGIPSGSAESEVHDATNKDAQNGPLEVTRESEHDTQAEPETDAAETKQVDETGGADAPPYADENVHDQAEAQYEEQYDSEPPKTESTSTAVPTSDQVEGLEPTEDFSGDAAEAVLDENDANYHNSTDPAGHGEGLDNRELPETPDEYQDELAGEETFAPGVNDHVQTVDLASVHDDGSLSQVDSASAAEDGSGDALHDNFDDQSESTVANVPTGESATQEQTLALEDDLLGIAEDILEGPPDNHEHDLDHLESADPEQDLEDGDADDVTADDDLVDDDSGDYDEDSYNILEISEHVELDEADLVHTDSQTHENPSKRAREEDDDEWDFEETSTPEIKRRRPS